MQPKFMSLHVCAYELTINSICTGTLILFANFIGAYQDVHLPPFIIESLQALSYLGAIAVSGFTCYNFIKKKIEHKKTK